MYQSAASTSCLRHAVLAVAYTNLANQSACASITNISHRAYGMAVASIKRAVEVPGSGVTNATAAAVSLMGLLDTIAESDKRRFLGVHGKALNSLLLSRTREQ